MEELIYLDIDPEFEDFTDEFPDDWDDLDGFFELDLDEEDEDGDLRRIEDYQKLIHEYFKKEVDGAKILVQINPDSLNGLELIVHPDGSVDKTKRQFEPDIYEDLAEDEFDIASPLEFNLYLKGIF